MPELSPDPKRLDPKTTALVLIDLQNGIVGMPLEPRPGTEIVAKARPLIEQFRAAHAPVVLVRVDFSPDFADALKQTVDQPLTRGTGSLPPGWSTFAEGLEQPGDIIITKRQWGAFHGTELDLQLRRRGIDTIVLAGITTNFGVESTARQAWEHGYNVLLLEDLCTSITRELHDMAVSHIFPRISRVVTSGSLCFTSK